MTEKTGPILNAPTEACKMLYVILRKRCAIFCTPVETDAAIAPTEMLIVLPNTPYISGTRLISNFPHA